MSYPDWFLKGLKSRSLVAERGSRRPLEPFVQEIVTGLRQWTNIEVYPCETSAASVDILINRRTTRALAWDSRYFEYLDATLTVAIAEPELNSATNLQCVYLAKVADKCASRLLKRSPQYAFGAKHIQWQIIGQNKIGPVNVLNQLRLTNLKNIARIWHVLHEVGHELYHTMPILVGNIDDKLKTILKGLEDRQSAHLYPQPSLRNLFQDELANKGILKTLASRLVSIRKVVSGTLDIPREEIWCDVFASEQLVLQLLTRKMDYSDAYLVLMLIYYSSATDLAADLFYNEDVPGDEYRAKVMSAPMAARADLRAEMLIASLVELVLRPQRRDVTSATEEWIGQHYKTLARFSEAETMSMKYVSPEARPHVLRVINDAYDKVDFAGRIKQHAEAYRMLRWDIPVM